MARYRVTDENENEIVQGSTVTDFRGDTGVFERVTRGVEYNGTAKVIVDGVERYATVFNLTVETLPDEDTKGLDQFLDRASESMLESLDAVVDVEQGLRDLHRKAEKDCD